MTCACSLQGRATGLDEIRFGCPARLFDHAGQDQSLHGRDDHMVCFQVMGCDQAVMLAVQAGQLELNVMMPLIASTCRSRWNC